MGIKWLTTFAKEIERIISSQARFEVVKGESSTQQAAGPTFVVDAWALIYHVWLSDQADSVREFNYHTYQASLTAILRAWQSAGIAIVLVFDGPELDGKLPTIIRRKATITTANAAFMKSSPTSRTSRRFQRECGLYVPLLLYSTIEAVEKMQSKQIEMIFAPTEADGLVAEIATEKERGYAVSLDSDFFVLCSRGKSCPYVPIDTIQYHMEIPQAAKTVEVVPTNGHVNDEMDGFQAVGRRKKGSRIPAAAPSNSLPHDSSLAQTQVTSTPVCSDGMLNAVVVRAYRPHDLAAHLKIPPNLLPVLAALVGNDYTTSAQSNFLFRNTHGTERILEAASLLREEWLKATNENKVGLREATKAAAGTRRGHARLQMTLATSDSMDDAKSDTFSSPSSATATPTRGTPGPYRSPTPMAVQDPVQAMLQAIIDRSLRQADAGYANPRYISSGERELILESIIDSIAAYSLLTHASAPHLASPSALFFGHPSSLITSDFAETIASPEGLERYRQAYVQGRFKESLIESMSRRIFLSTLSAEDPDVKSVQVTACREVRHWLWAVLFEVWGMSWAREDWDEPEEADEAEQDTPKEGGARNLAGLDKNYKEGEKPDDVISVNTESSNERSTEDGHEGEDVDRLDELPSRPGSVAELRGNIVKPPPGIIEYVRKGHQYSGDLVQIMPLRTLLAGALSDEASVELPSTLSQLRGQHEASRAGPGQDGEPASDPVPPAVVLMPLELRLDLYLHAHRACTASVKALPHAWWPLAASLRLSILHEGERLGVSKKKLNWSRGEIMAVIQSATAAQSSPLSSVQVADGERKVRLAVKEVLPSTRAIHLASTIVLLLETSYLLSQSLLLPVDIPKWPQPHTLYHAPSFHCKMDAAQIDVRTLEESLKKDEKAIFDAVTQELGEEMAVDVSELRRERKAKKKDAKAKEQPNQASDAARQGGSGGIKSSQARQAARNAFALLGDAAD